jgi:murein DD-endopeptidase MepM/ murein hydrolase activator NlpD
MTTSAHLARTLVREGDVVERGQPIALSGYSGLDALVTFPFGAPHVHFNTWLDGEPVDPFPHDGRPSLWRAGDLPEPVRETVTEPFTPSAYSESGVAAAIAACRTASSRAELASVEPGAPRGPWSR